MYGSFGGRTMVDSRRYYPLILFLFFLNPWIEATQQQPWFGELYEFEWRQSLTYQSYSKINKNSAAISYPENALFLNGGLSFTVSPEINVEFEATQAKTHRNQGLLDNFRLSARYRLLDDIAGDAISLVAGLTFTQAFKRSLFDKSSFHHGREEAEFFLSIGREQQVEAEWQSRWWTLVALGVADRGTIWTRTRVNYDYKVGESGYFQLFAHALAGWGKHDISLNHFRGYGLVRHRSIDLGLRYTYEKLYFGCAYIEYMQRVYARNFPDQTHSLRLGLHYTFGL